MARKSRKKGLFQRTDITLITLLAIVAAGTLIFGGILIWLFTIL